MPTLLYLQGKSDSKDQSLRGLQSIQGEEAWKKKGIAELAFTMKMAFVTGSEDW